MWLRSVRALAWSHAGHGHDPHRDSGKLDGKVVDLMEQDFLGHTLMLIRHFDSNQRAITSELSAYSEVVPGRFPDGNG